MMRRAQIGEFVFVPTTAARPVRLISEKILDPWIGRRVGSTGNYLTEDLEPLRFE